MTVAEREVCTVMAAVLHAHRALVGLGLLMTVVVAAAVTAASLSDIEIKTIALAVAVVVLTLGAIERYFAFRIQLDEKLFSALGNGKLSALANLDDALVRLDLIGRDRAARPLDERLKGATGLCWKHRAVVVIQFVAVVVFAVLQTL